MKKVFKTISIVLSILLFLAGLSAGVFMFLNVKDGLPEHQEKMGSLSVMKEKKSNGNNVIEVKESIKKSEMEEEWPDDTDEYSLQEGIHGMSHQKVISDEKWGFVPMTHQRINRLIKVVHINKNKYKHEDVYLDILNRWKGNDFSKADEDHNAIWELQNGNVGEANGVMTPKEEKVFIEKWYDVE
ncbi:DUF6241 domain-containing protein [Actinomycetes bacterium NPDC127524]